VRRSPFAHHRIILGLVGISRHPLFKNAVPLGDVLGLVQHSIIERVILGPSWDGKSSTEVSRHSEGCIDAMCYDF
jgi:hypothetical protein